jgi:uncharacterized protein YggU (UPF0235/DUF167 family)
MQPDLFQPQLAPGASIMVKVTPNCSRTRIIPTPLANGQIYFKVYLTEPANKGQANRALLKLIANYFNCPITSLVITKGQTNPCKTIIRN